MDGSLLFPPWIIHEAEFALYLADRDLELDPLGPVFLGGRLEDFSPDLSFTKMALNRQGDPLGTTFHSDEEHRFTVANLWVLERGTNALPRAVRNQQYIFVMRWQDPENQTWAKRSYYGATADGQSLTLGDQVFHQKITFTARYLDEQAGYQNAPDLAPALTASLRYVTAREQTDLYLYDFNSGNFTLARAGVETGRAAIVTGAGFWQIQFPGNVIVLRVTAGGVEAAGLNAIGGSFALGTAYPRVEFWIGPWRLGCVTAAGEFAIPGLNVTEAEPALSGRFMRVAIDGDWVFSLARNGAWATSFSETLP